MARMSIAQPVTAAAMITEWRWEPLSLVVIIAAGVGFARVRRHAGDRSRGLDLVFWLGLVAAVWTTCGFPGARADQLMWVWTTQQLLLLLIVPMIIMAGQPLEVLRRSGRPSRFLRVVESRPFRLLGHPFIAPVLIPVLCLLLFFSGFGEWSTSTIWAAGALHLILLTVGALIALPLLDRDDQRSSLAVGMALAVGFVELIVDAFPGAVLRYETHLALPAFGTGRPAWAPNWLADQHIAGGILWVVAELLDLPFLILAATRWIKADAREAASIDAELDATAESTDEPAEPWWLAHPELRERFERN